VHLVNAAKLAIDPEMPGFSDAFPSPDEARTLVQECYLDSHRKYIEAKTVDRW